MDLINNVYENNHIINEIDLSNINESVVQSNSISFKSETNVKQDYNSFKNKVTYQHQLQQQLASFIFNNDSQVNEFKI